MIGKNDTNSDRHLLQFDKALFISLTIGFILATVIGTLTHELSHYLVAKSLGYEAHLHYGSSSWTISYPGQPFILNDVILITLAGPLQTMLVGTIGFICLLIFRKSFQRSGQLSFRQWALIFIALFWLRQTFNCVVGFASYAIKGKFPGQGDEIQLAHYLQIPSWTIVVITGMIGVIVLGVVIFKFIPTKSRLTFIIAGLVGSVAGYISWFYLVGPRLMP